MVSERMRSLTAPTLFISLALILFGCSSDGTPVTLAADTTTAATETTVTDTVPDTQPVVFDTTVSVETVPSTLPSVTTTVVAPTLIPETAVTGKPLTELAEGVGLALPQGDCTPPTAAVEDAGEITFVKDGRVFAVDAGGNKATCIYDLRGRKIQRLSWSPDSTALLLGSDKVARGAKVAASGYLPSNLDVNWSGPNGTSLLAATAKGELVKRNSTTAKRTDISFLSEHQRSAYHPAGKAIASVGTGIDDTTGEETLGVFIASNVGADPRLLVRDETDAQLSELGFSASGDFLFFVAQHPGKFHFHEYDIEIGGLVEAIDSASPISNLTVSGVENAVAVRVGDCDAGTPADAQARLDSGGFISVRDSVPQVGGGSITPVGWLAEKRLLVITRTAGCSGPGELRLVDLQARTSKLITTEVEMAATRTRHVVPKELALPLDLQVEA